MIQGRQSIGDNDWEPGDRYYGIDIKALSDETLFEYFKEVLTHNDNFAQIKEAMKNIFGYKQVRSISLFFETKEDGVTPKRKFLSNKNPGFNDQTKGRKGYHRPHPMDTPVDPNDPTDVRGRIVLNQEEVYKIRRAFAEAYIQPLYEEREEGTTRQTNRGYDKFFADLTGPDKLEVQDLISYLRNEKIFGTRSSDGTPSEFLGLYACLAESTADGNFNLILSYSQDPYLTPSNQKMNEEEQERMFSGFIER